MLTLTIKRTLPNVDEWIDRVNSLVCVNNSRIGQTGDNEFVLFYSELGVDYGQSNLTPTEMATFVRNFYDEGFDDCIVIK